MKKDTHFSQEELDNISQLGDVLRSIHNRLLKEGKIKVKKGKVIWLDQEENENLNKRSKKVNRR